MKSLTIAFCTARKEPKVGWFLESIMPQFRKGDDVEVIIVDLLNRSQALMADWIKVIPPKPSIWYGPHRITKDQWWGKSSFLNTAACVATKEWFCAVDDRCFAVSGFIDAIREAMDGDYAVSGAYEKRIGMVVDQARIISDGEVVGTDPRNPKGRIKGPLKAYGEKWYGCCNALPLEWVLQIGGYPETICDSLGYEDSIFGHLICRNGWIQKYDPRMMVIQDRTSQEAEILVKRSDFGVSPHDKSHKIEEITSNSKTSKNSFDIRAMRAAIQRGESFPMPSDPHYDWYDGAYIPDKFNAI